MTIGTNVRSVTYASAGVGPYAIPFEFYEVEFLVDGVLAGGSYSLTGGDGATGSLTFLSDPGGSTITIRGNTTLNQTLSLSDTEAFPVSAIETAFDRAYAAIQESIESDERTIRVNTGTADPLIVENPGALMVSSANGIDEYNPSGPGYVTVDADGVPAILDLPDIPDVPEYFTQLSDTPGGLDPNKIAVVNSEGTALIWVDPATYAFSAVLTLDGQQEFHGSNADTGVDDDLDDWIGNGWWHSIARSGTTANAPPGDYATTEWSILNINNGVPDGSVSQMAFPAYSATDLSYAFYIRGRNSAGTWTDWISSAGNSAEKLLNLETRIILLEAFHGIVSESTVGTTHTFIEHLLTLGMIDGELTIVEPTDPEVGEFWLKADTGITNEVLPTGDAGIFRWNGTSWIKMSPVDYINHLSEQTGSSVRITIVADEAAMLASDLPAPALVYRVDTDTLFVLSATPATEVGNWQEVGAVEALPPITVADEAARLASGVEPGRFAFQQDTGEIWFLVASPATEANNWTVVYDNIVIEPGLGSTDPDLFFMCQL